MLDVPKGAWGCAEESRHHSRGLQSHHLSSYFNSLQLIWPLVSLPFSSVFMNHFFAKNSSFRKIPPPPARLRGPAWSYRVCLPCRPAPPSLASRSSQIPHHFLSVICPQQQSGKAERFGENDRRVIVKKRYLVMPGIKHLPLSGQRITGCIWNPRDLLPCTFYTSPCLCLCDPPWERLKLFW